MRGRERDLREPRVARWGGALTSLIGFAFLAAAVPGDGGAAWQARWEAPGEIGGLFMEGAVDLDRPHQPLRGDGMLLLLRATNGRLETLRAVGGEPMIVSEEGGWRTVRSTDRDRLATLLAPVPHQIGDRDRHITLSGEPLLAATGERDVWAGATMRGLPAVSIGDGAFQAGWSRDGVRYGVFGLLGDADEEDVASEGLGAFSDYLGFRWDPRSRTLRVVRLVEARMPLTSKDGDRAELVRELGQGVRRLADQR